ncbi:MAG: hypothetical protein C5B52_01680 [Bacteroidetes bacterium]|nr:MAG: hypothetical protein C5B52_01680 [Bacteroidota bacterium]
MDSRLIYARSKYFISSVQWHRHGDSEWLYCGDGKDVKLGFINSQIEHHFSEDFLYVSWTRTESFMTSKEFVMEIVSKIWGEHNKFSIWDRDFKKVIEFDCYIGILRLGEK